MKYLSINDIDNYTHLDLLPFDLFLIYFENIVSGGCRFVSSKLIKICAIITKSLTIQSLITCICVARPEQYTKNLINSIISCVK